MKISVNGEPHDFEGGYVTYEQIVDLAGERGSPSVVYHARIGGAPRATAGTPHGKGKGSTGMVACSLSGMMHVGCEPLAIVDGMTFSVVHTGNA